MWESRQIRLESEGWGPMFLSNFASLSPQFRIGQGDALKWLAWIHSKNSESKSQESLTKLFARFGCSPEKIQARFYEHPSYGDQSQEGQKLFSVINGEVGFPISQRMLFFEKIGDQRMQEFYEKEQVAPGLLIHISCTGYVSPSAAQKLVVRKEWNRSTEVSHAYHMGCYASLPAIRQAADYLTAPRSREGSRVDLVHNELCTLHLNPALQTPEQMVVQSLFADGHIRYSAHRARPSQNALQVISIQEELIADSIDAMTWRVSEVGFEMSLAREVPDLIQRSLRSALERMCDHADVDTKSLESAIFAIHPGGPRIIDLVEDHFKLQPWQSKASRQVLANHGNMSSATLPHVWKKILEDTQTPNDVLVISFAFGPGLTIFSSIMKVKKHDDA